MSPQNPIDPNEEKHLCPFCLSSRLRPSRRKTFLDLAAVLALMRPVKCRMCDKRFYCWRWEKLGSVKRNARQRGNESGL